MLRILFIEDNEDLAFAVSETLKILGDYEITRTHNGAEGLRLYSEIQPDIVISDIEMPLMNGFEVAQSIRNVDKQCIIFLATGLCESKDVVKGFDIGVDEYVKKPYAAPELHARIQAIYKRFDRASRVVASSSQSLPTIGKYTFDMDNKCLYFNSESIKLTAKEFDILALLYNNRNQLVPKKEFTQKLWGETDFFNSRSLDVFIRKLRKHLSKDNAVQIVTVRGKGLKLKM